MGGLLFQAFIYLCAAVIAVPIAKRLGLGPFKTGRNIYGKRPALFVQLHLEFEDGTNELVNTDATWKVNTGPVTEADLVFGESYDAQKEHPGWATADFDAAAWHELSLRADHSVLAAGVAAV